MKFVDDMCMQNILQTTNGSVEYRHVTGEISIASREEATIAMWLILIANLPPEVTERSILASYGETVSLQFEIWPKESNETPT